MSVSEKNNSISEGIYHAFCQQVHWIQRKSLKPFFVQNFYHTINLIALSSVKLYSNVNCAEYKEFQWSAAAVFELTSDIPDSDFHFDFWGL